MNAVSKSKVFKSGNSLAVRLPKSFGMTEGTEVEVARQGINIVVRPIADPAVEKAKLTRMIDRLRAIGPVGEIEFREPFDAPDRPGL